MDIRSVLFPTDFSVYSEKAREYAIYLGRRLNASIHILHVIEPLDYPEVDAEVQKFYKDLEAQMVKKMEKEREIFEKEGLNVDKSILIGQRWRVINTVAKENNIDLIVMGSHGIKTDSGELTVGTTSHKVVFSSPCPVLIVRHEEWSR